MKKRTNKRKEETTVGIRREEVTQGVLIVIIATG